MTILDKEQQEACKEIYYDSLIIAGAGSGKTTTLIGKITYLIENKYAKENEILVLSFTNATVNDFKRKCKYNIEVSTFHKEALKYNIYNSDIISEEILENTIINIYQSANNKIKKYIYKYNYGNFKKYNIEKYNKSISENNSSSILNMSKNFLKYIKSNNIDLKKIKIGKLNKKEILMIAIFEKIIEVYSKTLKDNNFQDFDDIIINATNNIYSKNYKYIFVDEFQDISKIRLDFLKKLLEINKATLTAVGDDWQSIYGFSGSNIELFYNFKKYFKNAKIYKLKKTYRCPNDIIRKSTKFILKNKLQIPKMITSTNISTKNNIKKMYTNNEIKALYKLIDKYGNTEKEIYILSRNTYDINKYISNIFNLKDNQIIYKKELKKNIKFLTIHSSKGLEADIIIIINLKNTIDGIPTKKENKLLKKIIVNKEPINYAEERRLFYVALTRAKEKVYLIIDSKNESKFIKEI